MTPSIADLDPWDLFCKANQTSCDIQSALRTLILFMAKTSVVARNEKRKKTVKKYAAKRAALKAAGDYEGLQKLPRNASPVRVKNRCSVTGRSKGYLRKFGLSRMKFRELANEGKLPGVRKSSW